MINCTLKASPRASRISELDPLLDKYSAEYHYLFELVVSCRALPADDVKDTVLSSAQCCPASPRAFWRSRFQTRALAFATG